VPGGRRLNHPASFRDLSGAVLGALAQAEAGCGDGQPRFSQGPQIRELTEVRGCQLIYLPPFLRDLNPIEETFAKRKALFRNAEARTREALLEAICGFLDVVTARDARGLLRALRLPRYGPTAKTTL
jgi:hypothetical protein